MSLKTEVASLIRDFRKFFFHLPENRLDLKYQAIVVKWMLIAFTALICSIVYVVLGN